MWNRFFHWLICSSDKGRFISSKHFVLLLKTIIYFKKSINQNKWFTLKPTRLDQKVLQISYISFVNKQDTPRLLTVKLKCYDTKYKFCCRHADEELARKRKNSFVRVIVLKCGVIISISYLQINYLLSQELSLINGIQKCKSSAGFGMLGCLNE